MKVFCCWSRVIRMLLILAAHVAPLAAAEPLTFRRAIEMAVRNSSTVAAARAEQVRAHQSYLATRNTYVPQVVVGSGLAKSFGFPMTIEGSAPSIVNVNAQSFLLNPAQREFVRAARTEWEGSLYNLEDSRQQAILDTATIYMHLDRLKSSLNLLRQQESSAYRVQEITSERVQVGVDSPVELTKAKLGAARVRMSMAQVMGEMDLLRNQLSQLTGAPAQSLETVTGSIPELPPLQEDTTLPAKAAAVSPVVKLAEAQAAAQQIRARGEHKQLYPAVDFVAQYGLFSRFNNFEDFFRKFQRHNGTLGVSIRFPFLNFSQRAQAEAADAEAAQARKKAVDARNKVSNQTLQLQHAVEQFTAARDVVRLEYKLASAEVETAQAKVQAGTASLRDLENARVAESQKYVAFVDAGYQLEKAQMELMRATGELEKWALGDK